MNFFIVEKEFALIVRYTPDKIFINVDLPAPFSPTMTLTLPVCTSKFTLSNAITPPNLLVMPWASNNISGRFSNLVVEFDDQRDHFNPIYLWVHNINCNGSLNIRASPIFAFFLKGGTTVSRTILFSSTEMELKSIVF